MMAIDNEVKDLAKYLAIENRKGDPEILRVYWFPNEQEVRLIEVHPSIPLSEDKIVHPFYFGPAPEECISKSSSIALIRPEEWGNMQLPEGWGNWSQAIEI